MSRWARSPDRSRTAVRFFAQGASAREIRRQHSSESGAGARSSSLSIDSRARGAPTQQRWSADRPAIRPTRWRRLLAAVATSRIRVGGWCGRRGAGFDGVVGGAGATDDDAAAAAGRSARFSYGVIAKHAALKLRQFRRRTVFVLSRGLVWRGGRKRNPCLLPPIL
jgi:hypothetical protein